MRFYFSALGIIVTILFQDPFAHAATEITGTVTARRGDSAQVTFQPHETAGRVEYRYILRDVKIQSQGQLYRHPGAVFTFVFDKGLRLRDDPFFDILFPDGGHLAGDFVPPAGDAMETHREHRRQAFEKYYTDSDDPLDDEIRIIWKDRTIQGENTTFISSQAVRTTRDRKTLSVVETQQTFIATASTPPSHSEQESNTMLKGFWEFAMTVDAPPPHELDTMRWERVFQEIFRSASIKLNDSAVPR